MSDLKSLFLKNLHTKCGAKFGAFAGYTMPIVYPDGLVAEHLHTRSKASLFDVSHMGQVTIRGTQAIAFLNRILPIPCEKLAVGKERYTLMLNESAGIIDDLIVTRIDEDEFFIVLNAACLEKDLKHIRAVAEQFQGLEIELVADRVLCALQGPKAEVVLQDILDDSIATLSFMRGRRVAYGKTNVWVNRSGYTGEDGFEISIPHTIAEELVEKILQHELAKPAGLGARDSLRLEAGLSLYGNDMDETTNVYEANLGFAISPLRLKKESPIEDFIGGKALRALAGKTSRKRVGILPVGKAPIREGRLLYESAESETSIGKICSGGFGPTLNAPVAMGYVDSPHNDEGTTLWADLRARRLEVKVATLPFVLHKYKK